MQSLNLIPERNALPEKGARFWREGGEVMFRFVIDAGNIVGPRLANRTDSENHPHAWGDFVASDREPEPDPPATALAAELLETHVEAGGCAPPVTVMETPRPKRAYTKRKAA